MFLFFLPLDCFLSTYIATEYAFTSSIHYDPPRMAMVAAAAAVVLHTHTLYSYVSPLRSQCSTVRSFSVRRQQQRLLSILERPLPVT